MLIIKALNNGHHLLTKCAIVPLAVIGVAWSLAGCLRTGKPEDPMAMRPKQYNLQRPLTPAKPPAKSPTTLSPADQNKPIHPKPNQQKQAGTVTPGPTSAQQPPQKTPAATPLPTLPTPTKTVNLHLQGWNSRSPGKLRSLPKQDIENKLPFQIKNISVTSANNLVLKAIDSSPKEKDKANDKNKWTVSIFDTRTRRLAVYHLNDIIHFTSRHGEQVSLKIYYLEKHLIYLENRATPMLSPGVVKVGEPLKYTNAMNIVYNHKPKQLIQNIVTELDGHKYLFMGMKRDKLAFYALLNEDGKTLYKIYMPY